MKLWRTLPWYSNIFLLMHLKALRRLQYVSGWQLNKEINHTETFILVCLSSSITLTLRVSQEGRGKKIQYQCLNNNNTFKFYQNSISLKNTQGKMPLFLPLHRQWGWNFVTRATTSRLLNIGGGLTPRQTGQKHHITSVEAPEIRVRLLLSFSSTKACIDLRDLLASGLGRHKVWTDVYVDRQEVSLTLSLSLHSPLLTAPSHPASPTHSSLLQRLSGPVVPPSTGTMQAFVPR